MNKSWFILAGIIWVGPKLTPQEAADVLRPNSFTQPKTYDGPHVFIINYHPPYRYEPRRRLDGTLLSHPPIVYGGWIRRWWY